MRERECGREKEKEIKEDRSIDREVVRERDEVSRSKCRRSVKG